MIRAYWFNLNRNFGDQLTPRLTEALSGRRVGYCDDFARCQLVAVGSILHLVPSETFRGRIWGAGFIQRPDKPRVFPHARICALRGELTRELLGAGPDVALGDPGLLADRFAKPTAKRYPLGIVPHFVDVENDRVQAIVSKPGVHRIDVFNDVERVVHEIAQCEAIISSSLHGLIVADALGVANRWVRLSDGVIGGDFKFRDYYSIYGIEDPSPMELTPEDTAETIRAKIGPCERRGIEQIKRRLLESFPFPRRWWFGRRRK